MEFFILDWDDSESDRQRAITQYGQYTLTYQAANWSLKFETHDGKREYIPCLGQRHAKYKADTHHLKLVKRYHTQ
jgi:hypothetical protein